MATTYTTIKPFECPEGHHFKAAVEWNTETRTGTYKPTSLTTEDGPRFLDGVRMPLPVCPVCMTMAHEKGFKRGANAQVSESEASSVAIHPGTGEVVYCFARPDAPMPEMYKAEGFQKVQFHHFSDLQRFCRDRGLVNDIEGDWHKDDGYFEEDLARRRKIEKEQYEYYMNEREKARKAGW